MEWDIISSLLVNGSQEVTMFKLKVGDPAPDFSLPSHLDQDVRLSGLRGKTVVLAFYPMAWTPI
jgi:peroxiredoxin